MPTGRGRLFYHAGCEPLRTAEELARGEREADRVNWRKDAWKAEPGRGQTITLGRTTNRPKLPDSSTVTDASASGESLPGVRGREASPRAHRRLRCDREGAHLARLAPRRLRVERLHRQGGRGPAWERSRRGRRVSGAAPGAIPLDRCVGDPRCERPVHADRERRRAHGRPMCAPASSHR